MNYSTGINIIPVETCSLSQIFEFLAWGWQPTDPQTDATLNRPKDRILAKETKDTLWYTKMDMVAKKIKFWLQKNALEVSGIINSRKVCKISFKSTPIPREKTMSISQQNELYREYCQSVQQGAYPSHTVLKDNLAKAQQEHRQRILESGRHFIDCRYKEYDRKLADIALAQCKSKKEWQDMEADDRRMKATGVITHKSAQELLEHYIDKINRSYQAEQWYMTEIRKCEQELEKIEQSNISARRKHNKLEHWRARKHKYLANLHIQTIKTERFERLITKWRGICEKIRIAEIAHEIRNERTGDGNKYGFNPNMQDRGTATGIFIDD